MSIKEYSKIKTLLGAEVKCSDIERLLGRSSATISTINKSSSFEDYLRIVRMYVARYQKNKASISPLTPPAPMVDPDAPEEGDLTDLELISRKLSAIFDILQKTYELKLSAVEHAKQRSKFYADKGQGPTQRSGGFFSRFLDKDPNSIKGPEIKNY